MKILFRKSLMVAALCASFVSFSAKTHAQHGLIREVYNNVTGGIDGLLANPNYPGNPALSEIISDFETPANIGSNYGQRVRGYIEAPETGEYTFWISSDDAGQLFLSSSENPNNRTKIAEVLGATASHSWDQEGGQRSAPITLQKGQRYYIEALMIEFGGDDHLEVRWALPDGTIEDPIPNSRLYVELIPPFISRQPQNVTVDEGGNATFTIQFANRAPVALQWHRNDVAIPGETNTTLIVSGVKVTDSGSRFTVRATNAFSVNPTVSAVAFLNVRRDVTPPTIVAAQTGGENDLLTVSFSEPIDPASITDLSNFFIIDDAQVLGASLDARGTTLILRTTPLTFGQPSTLLINNVRDRADQPNAIEPDSAVDFTYGYSALPAELVYGKSEKPGPSTRRTGLVISEIMYHPALRPDGRNLEFIELYNSQEFIETIGGYKLRGAVDFTFPSGTFIPARGYVVVAASPVDVQAVYGLARAVSGPFTNALPDTGTLRLLNDQGALLFEVSYDSQGEWPVAPDGGGNSLVLARPSYGEADPRAWAASQFTGGSPGSPEPVSPNPYAGLVINEFLTHTDLPQLDFLELYNYSTREIDLSDVSITDDPETNKFSIPKGTRLPPLGFLKYFETDLHFALSAAGEKIVLRDPSRTRIIDAVRFGPQPNGVSVGRSPDGNPVFRQLSSPTPGTANTPPRLPEVVINEIMYNPVSGNQDEEFVELYNRSGQTINLYGWRLEDGIGYTFAQNFFLSPGAYLVIAKNLGLLRTNHPGLTAANSVGNFNGNLSNGGERIALERPESLLSTNNNVITTNIVHVLVDEVSYKTGGRWPSWADGGGSSMELIDPNSDNDEPSNWTDSDETKKSEWVTIQRRGILNWGSTNLAVANPSRAVHVLMMDQGEALLDNVQVFRDGGPNLVSNSGFEQGNRDWLFGGTHDSSTVEINSGRDSLNAVHIRAAERGDTAANRIRGRLSSGITNGEIATIKADVRWLRGTPEILLRLHGNYLELAGVMPVPKNLGTPGAVNSRRVDNSGPAIQHVQHSPAVPAPNQPVRVIAELKDPNRVAVAMLYYRVDPSTNFNRLPMSYNGAGFYSAVIPGQTAGTNVAFYVEALDAAGGLARFPADAPAREAIIVFGDGTRVGSNFGIYRLWLSQTNLTRWRVREQASNKPLDATFVYNDDRIIYNMGTLYSGSPFHWRGYNGPLGNGANYLMVMPKDDLFLGQTDSVLNLPSNIASDGTGIREQVAYWMADQINHPFTYRRYHHLFINGVARGASSIFEDVQQPNSDFLREWFPNDSDGELYKIEDWFEYTDTFSFVNLDAELTAFYTRNLTNNLPELKKERYRWWWRKRAVNDSAHDYSELFQLIQAVNTTNTADFIARTEALIDVDEWMTAMALRHAVGDWDAYGYSRGKNMYAYKPQNGKWQLLHWDIAFSFGLGDPAIPSDPVADGLFAVQHFDGTEDLITKRMFETPVYRRAYLRALYEIASGPMSASKVNPIIDTKSAALVGNGIPVSPPDSVKSWIATRRDYILSQVAAADSGFKITVNNGANFSTNRNTLELTGTAPVNVRTIKVNGLDYPIEWTSINTWRTRVALKPSSNLLKVEGFDSNGQPISGASSSITVTLTGNGEAITNRVIIDEILYDPLAPETEFVELHNTARITSYDLSGYRLNGLDFTFPAGSVIPPGGFLVLARDPVAFGNRFGFTVPLAGVFAGAVDNQGETLSLIGPGSGGSNEVVVSAIRFEGGAPWPAPTGGASLQLIDPAQDPTRVGNWGIFPGNATPGATNSVRQTLSAFPPIWVNEVQPINLNGLTDAAGDRDPWVEIYNSGTTPVSLSGLYLTDDFSLPMKWAFPNASLAPGQRAIVWLDGEPAESTATQWHTSFRLNPTNSAIGLVGLQRGIPAVFDYLLFDQVPAGQSFGAFPEAQAVRRETFFKATGGTANDLSVPPVRVLINEWQAANVTTIQDPDDLDFDDWFELHNAGSQAADLSGYTLTDNLTNRTKFTIPSGTVIPAGGFLLVWADEERSTNGQLHVNFKLSASGEEIGLFAPDGSVVDSVMFGLQGDDVSRGRLTDGGAQIGDLPRPSPGTSNAGTDPNALRFTAISVSQNQFTMTWNSEAGATYRVEYKSSLGDANWTLLRTVQAVGTLTSTMDSLAEGHRFYRLLKQ